MGMMDTAKMVRKAMQAKSQMQKITAVGRSKSGKTAVLINGLNDVLELEIDPTLISNQNVNEVEIDVIEAFKDARKNLEKTMADGLNMEDIRDMLS